MRFPVSLRHLFDCPVDCPDARTRGRLQDMGYHLLRVETSSRHFPVHYVILDPLGTPVNGPDAKREDRHAFLDMCKSIRDEARIPLLAGWLRPSAPTTGRNDISP